MERFQQSDSQPSYIKIRYISEVGGLGAVTSVIPTFRIQDPDEVVQLLVVPNEETEPV